MFSILPAETLRRKLRYPTCSDYVYIEDITGSISIFSICFRHGGLCVLDGLQQLRPMTLSALAPLLQEGMLWGNWSRCFWEKSSSEDVGTICGEDLCSVGRAHTSYFLVSMKEWIRINNLFTANDVAKGHFLISLPIEAARIARWPYTMVFASSLPGVGSTCRDVWPNRHAKIRCAWHIPAFGCWHWQHLPKWHLVKVTWNDMKDDTLVPAMRRFWKETTSRLSRNKSINFWVMRRSNLSPRWS